MTREAFVNQYLDEMVGLLLAAFHSEVSSRSPGKEEAIGYAKTGLFFVNQQRRARDLLTRMWESLQADRPSKKSPELTKGERSGNSNGQADREQIAGTTPGVKTG